MATNPNVAIYGDKIVETLNAATLSATFTAARKWSPFWKDAESVSALRVTVVPSVFEESPDGGTRDHGDEMQDVLVGVQKKLTEVETDGNLKNSEVDSLVYLAEEIRSLFYQTRLGSDPNPMVVAAPYVILGDDLTDHRIFTAIVTLKLDRGE